MEFDRSRVYTAVNADELRAGDRIIVADNLFSLMQKVTEHYKDTIRTLEKIKPNRYGYRFQITTGDKFILAYLVKRKENCTNCGNRGNSYCSCFTRDKSNNELSRTVCSNYIRLAERYSKE